MLTIQSLPVDAVCVEPPRREGGGIAPKILEAVVPVPGSENLVASLADPDVLLVTTGQQPGLLTGPLFTLYKALSAAALAQILTDRWARPVRPLFWIAGDDHDFQEATGISWVDRSGEVVEERLRTRSDDAPMTPMYQEPLGPEIEELLNRLGDSLPPSEFRDGVLDWLGKTYRPDATIAGAFGRALAELLAPWGIACLESTHPRVKEAMAPRLIEALDCAVEINDSLGRLGAELEAVGIPSPMPLGDGASLVFLEGQQGRDRLTMAGDAFETRRSQERFSLAALQSIASEDPTRLSPNVLLRPVVESALLPTVAYVAGPGERRYLPLCKPVYEALGIHCQPPLPRWSGLLIEPPVERVLDKFGTTVEELLTSGPTLEARIAREHVPDRAIEALTRLREAARREYEVVSDVAKGIDPTLERPVAGALHHVLSGADTVEKKLVSHQRKREATELAQIGRARTALLPGGKPQERTLTVAPFLSRYGSTLLARLLDSIREWYETKLAPAPQGP